MFLSWVVPGTNVIYHCSSTLESVLAVVVGPSKLDGDFLGIWYEVNGKMITHDCAPLHRAEFQKPSRTATIKRPPRKNQNCSKASWNHWQPPKKPHEQRFCASNYSFLGFHGLFRWVLLVMVHRRLTPNSCHGADAVHARRKNDLWGDSPRGWGVVYIQSSGFLQPTAESPLLQSDLPNSYRCRRARGLVLCRTGPPPCPPDRVR